LLLALFSKHPDIKVTLVNRSVDKAGLLFKDPDAEWENMVNNMKKSDKAR